MKKEKPKKRISTASAKSKGRELQSWVAYKLSLLTGFEWGTAIHGDLPIQPRPMGQAGSDIRLESDVKEYLSDLTNGILTGQAIECKRQENWAIPQWIEQVKQYTDGEDWLLFCRKNRKNCIVVLDAETFFAILELIAANKSIYF